jgi:hypothetical protein
MKKTYRGSCHCGAVRFEADADLEQGTFKCNCSICTKSRSWMAFVPRSDVRMLAGEDKLGDYQFGQKRIHHMFCRICGVRPFGRTTDGKGNEVVALRVNCLDGVGPGTLADIPVRYFDMLHDRPESPPAETRHL